MIDDAARHLKSFEDADLSERLYGDGDALEKLVERARGLSRGWRERGPRP